MWRKVRLRVACTSPTCVSQLVPCADAKLKRLFGKHASSSDRRRGESDMTVRVVLPTRGESDPEAALAASYDDRGEVTLLNVNSRMTTAELMGHLATLATDACGGTSFDFYVERSPACRRAKPDEASQRFVAARRGDAAVPDAVGEDASALGPPMRGLEKLRFPKRAVSHWFYPHGGNRSTDRVLVVPKPT